MRAITRLAKEGRGVIDRHPDHAFTSLIFATVGALALLGGIREMTLGHWSSGCITIGVAGLLFSVYGVWTLHLFEQDQAAERQRLVEAADHFMKGVGKA